MCGFKGAKLTKNCTSCENNDSYIFQLKNILQFTIDNVSFLYALLKKNYIFF